MTTQTQQDDGPAGDDDEEDGDIDQEMEDVDSSSPEESGAAEMKKEPSSSANKTRASTSSDDNVESSSAGSSSEGKGSRGSGGGYSADCSASDQSSDDGGGGNRNKTNEGQAMPGGPKMMKLPVLERMSLKDSRNGAGDGNSGTEGNASSGTLPDADEEDSRDDDESDETDESSAVSKAKKPNSGGSNNSSGKKALLMKGAQQPTAFSTAVSPGDVGQLATNKDSSTAPSGEPLVGAAAVSNLKPPPADASMMMDVDAVNKQMQQQPQHQQQQCQQGQRGGGGDNMNLRVAASSDSQPLPQWGGVRIAHPMDPRIDLSTVIVQNGTTTGPTSAAGVGAVGSQHQQAVAAATATVNGLGNPAPTIESYLQLLEVVRPFFQAHGIPYQASAEYDGSEDEEALSSEGFTSFFSTTHSSANNDSNANHSSSSDLDKKPKAVQHPQIAAAAAAAAADERLANNHEEHQDPQEDNTDTSSMVVLARVKPKYRRASEEEDDNTSSSSSRGRGRRVRIQEGNQPRNQQDNEGGPLPRQDGEPPPPGGGGDVANAAVAHAAAAPPPQPNNEDDNNNNEPESSMSSTSSEHPDAAEQAAGARHMIPPRIVTDISSSNRTDSNSSSNPNSGSGSGSGSGTGSGANTGSGSNQGSSGSGNDASGDQDGKGSSEDVAKEDNSGDGTTNDNSDGARYSDSKRLGLGLDKVAHRHENAAYEALLMKPGKQQPPCKDATMQEAEDLEAARERKLLDKKRKRIEMRREYEAQQQSESSENTVYGNTLLRPGKPVTLETVLQFSRIPRIVIQSTPPFLVVHTNAAYSRLTGIDSHAVVGKPITSLLSIPDNLLSENGNEVQQRQQQQQGAAAPGDPSATPAEDHSQLSEAGAAGRGRASRQSRRSVGLERLVAASGFGRLHVIQVHAKPHNMVGKNVTVIQNAPEGRAGAGGGSLGSRGRRDEGSNNDTSVASSGRYDNGHTILTVKCRSSIAPVVSSPSAMDSVVVTDKELTAQHPKAKRRKVHEQDAHRKHGACFSKEMASIQRRHNQRHVITHYVIQLQPQENAQGSEESLSSNSTSVEARLLGLSKLELQKQRLAVGAALAQQELEERPDNDAAGSESSDTREPVSAIG